MNLVTESYRFVYDTILNPEEALRRFELSVLDIMQIIRIDTRPDELNLNAWEYRVTLTDEIINEGKQDVYEPSESRCWLSKKKNSTWVMEPLERGCAGVICKCEHWKHEETAKEIVTLLNMKRKLQ